MNFGQMFPARSIRTRMDLRESPPIENEAKINERPSKTTPQASLSVHTTKIDLEPIKTEALT